MADTSADDALEAQTSALSGVSSPDTQLTRITHALQTAVFGQDRGQLAQLLPSLLQHLSVLPQQRHVPLTTGLQLLQLGAQALNLAGGNAQVLQPTHSHFSKVNVSYQHRSANSFVNFQTQQAGCQVLRAVSQATIGLQAAESDQVPMLNL